MRLPTSVLTLICCFSLLPAADETPVTPGPFSATDASLAQYRYPDWFRDAKFGIWAHWGPQAVPRHGDWYAKKMYEGGGDPDPKTGQPRKPSADYTHHVQAYGHPSAFGYKDIIPLWKAERWDPEKLMALYKRVGAKYFVSMGSHHDNFYLWASKLHRWNAAAMGPKQDVVGRWQQAAQKEGLRFGVSEHLAASYTWFQAAHGADRSGPKAGVPYDGNDPQFQDLYHTPAAKGDTAWLTTNPAWHQRWFAVVKELVETYHPDLLYSDSKLPFDGVGRAMLANYYNQDIAHRGGTLEAVYNCKEESKGKWVRDYERGVADRIYEDPWQTDTSIGDWFYSTGQKYTDAGQVVRMLIDITSKNGNLLLNVVQTPEGDLEDDVLNILDGIGRWMDANKEGIHGTRPWKIYGEGPGIVALQQEKGHFGGLRDVPKRPFEPGDFRFTQSKDGTVVYAFEMAAPTGEVRITSLGRKATITDKSVAGVQILGSSETLTWKQDDDALVISKPTTIPHQAAVGYRITLR